MRFTSATNPMTYDTAVQALISNQEVQSLAGNRILDQIIKGVADKYIENHYDEIVGALDFDYLGAEIGKTIGELLRSKMEDM